MPFRMALTSTQREKMGVLVNNFNIFAAQLLTGGNQEIVARAISNLGRIKQREGDLLRQLDKLARDSGDESALRLIEDLARIPVNLIQILAVVRRCLMASAFLGHCIAHGEVSVSNADAKQLH